MTARSRLRRCASDGSNICASELRLPRCRRRVCRPAAFWIDQPAEIRTVGDHRASLRPDRELVARRPARRRVRPVHLDERGLEVEAAEVYWPYPPRSEEHTSEIQSHHDVVCRVLLDKKKRDL